MTVHNCVGLVVLSNREDKLMVLNLFDDQSGCVFAILARKRKNCRNVTHLASVHVHAIAVMFVT